MRSFSASTHARSAPRCGRSISVGVVAGIGGASARGGPGAVCSTLPRRDRCARWPSSARAQCEPKSDHQERDGRRWVGRQAGDQRQQRTAGSHALVRIAGDSHTRISGALALRCRASKNRDRRERRRPSGDGRPPTARAARASVRAMPQHAGPFDAQHLDIAARLATPCPRPLGRMASRPVLDLGCARRRQDAPGARARRRPAREAGLQARRRALPDDAADAPVGRGRGGARRAAPAGCRVRGPAARLSRRRGHLRAGRERPVGVGAKAPPRHVRRSSTRPTISARTWPGASASRRRSRRPSAGCCSPARRFARTPRRSRASATTPTAWPCPTSPTPTREAVARRRLPPGAFVATTAAVVAQRRRRDRVLLRDRAHRRARRAGATARRSRPSFPTGCRGSSRRPTPSCERCRQAATATRPPSSIAADSDARAPDRQAAAEATGRAPVVVLHRGARARQACRVHGSRDPWIVAVNMVSEGVDIPRLRVGVYATAAKTPLIFRQIVGRFVRTIPGQRGRAELALRPGRPDPARPCGQIESELRGSCDPARSPPRLGRARRAARDRAFAEPRLRAAERRVRGADDAVRRAPGRAWVRSGPRYCRCRRRKALRARAGAGATCGLRAARRAAPRAQPPRRRARPAQEKQSSRDQRMAEPGRRHRARDRCDDRAARALGGGAGEELTRGRPVARGRVSRPKLTTCSHGAIKSKSTGLDVGTSRRIQEGRMTVTDHVAYGGCGGFAASHRPQWCAPARWRSLWRALRTPR